MVNLVVGVVSFGVEVVAITELKVDLRVDVEIEALVDVLAVDGTAVGVDAWVEVETIVEFNIFCVVRSVGTVTFIATFVLISVKASSTGVVFTSASVGSSKKYQ